MAYDTVVSSGSNSTLVSALKKEAEFVQDFMDELYSTVVDASRYWEGQSYEAFASLLGKYSNYFYNYIDMLNVFVEALDGEATDAIKKLEKDVKETMDAV